MKMTPQETSDWFTLRYEYLGLTQEEFAEKVNISGGNISRYKQQKVKPRIEQVESLAEAFEVNLLTLLIVLGVVDPDSTRLPQLVKGQKNSKVIWKM